MQQNTQQALAIVLFGVAVVCAVAALQTLRRLRKCQTSRKQF